MTIADKLVYFTMGASILLFVADYTAHQRQYFEISHALH